MRRLLVVLICLGAFLASMRADAGLLLLGVGGGGEGGTPPSGCILAAAGSKLLNATASCILIH